MQRPRDEDDGNASENSNVDERRLGDGRRQEEVRSPPRESSEGQNDEGQVGIVTQPTLNPAFAVGTVTQISDAELTVSSDDGANFWVLPRDANSMALQLLSRVRYSTGPTGFVSLVGGAVDAHEAAVSAPRAHGVVTQPISDASLGTLTVMGGPLAGKMVQFGVELSGPALEAATAGTFAVFYVVRVSDDRLVALSTRVTSSGASNLWEGVIVSADQHAAATARYWSQVDQQVGGEVLMFAGDNPRLSFQRGSRFEFESSAEGGAVERISEATPLPAELRRGIIVPDGAAADTFALRSRNNAHSLSVGNEVTFIPLRGSSIQALVVSSKLTTVAPLPPLEPPVATAETAPKQELSRTEKCENVKLKRLVANGGGLVGVILEVESDGTKALARIWSRACDGTGANEKITLADNPKLEFKRGVRFLADRQPQKGGRRSLEVLNAIPEEKIELGTITSDFKAASRAYDVTVGDTDEIVKAHTTNNAAFIRDSAVKIGDVLSFVRLMSARGNWDSMLLGVHSRGPGTAPLTIEVPNSEKPQQRLSQKHESDDGRPSKQVSSRSEDQQKGDQKGSSVEHEGVICLKANQNGEHRVRYRAVGGTSGGDINVDMKENRRVKGLRGDVFRFKAPLNFGSAWTIRNAWPTPPTLRRGKVVRWSPTSGGHIKDDVTGKDVIAPEYFHRHGWFRSLHNGDEVIYVGLHTPGEHRDREEVLCFVKGHDGDGNPLFLPPADDASRPSNTDRGGKASSGRSSASAAAPQQQPSAPRPSAGGSSAAAGVVTRPKFCMECGTKIVSDTQKFCTECGTPIVGVPR